PPLPPIPAVHGPLRVHVVYPASDALIAARDSNFIFGSVGTGDATLSIDGVPVEVQPNGAFLAFLPVPRAPRYELVAAAGGDTVRLTHPVRLLPPPLALPDTGRLRVDSASVTPAEPLTLRAGEMVRVGVRAPSNATVAVETSDGVTLPLALVDETRWATDLAAVRFAPGAELVVARGVDTVRLALPAVTATAPGARTLVRLGDPEPADSGDRRIVGRPVAGGTYRWFFVPGTVVERTGAAGTQQRVRLAADLEVWVNGADVRELPDATPAPRRVVGNARVEPAAEWVDLVLPVSERPPYLVEERDDAIVLTLYGTTANTDIIHFVAGDSLVRDVTWAQRPGGRAEYRVHLARAPYGYLALWRDGAFVLRVRRPPAVDPRAPLRGIRVAVDPGHPPIGATGPTGLYEAEATLAIGRELRAELERRGATVVMTRTTMAPVALGDRPIMARRAGAHVLVSVHLNALPDGVNPFETNGTGTYYFHPQAAALARAVQAGMVRRMGLRDLGVNYDNLALARPTWMPAVLCEGAFLMIPEQEAALRTPEFQRAYARGVADGLEAYFRSLAEPR
ncbi:MAG TPA: N-acetylmuramoyl-L-alanine amidase, partial [Gemmatimonadaceae bacterium]|nr:N-acetylmuramoyl-L-alanine amidase [Gemmatimonadaceae bacterium]